MLYTVSHHNEFSISTGDPIGNWASMRIRQSSPGPEWPEVFFMLSEVLVWIKYLTISSTVNFCIIFAESDHSSYIKQISNTSSF